MRRKPTWQGAPPAALRLRSATYRQTEYPPGACLLPWRREPRAGCLFILRNLGPMGASLN